MKNIFYIFLFCSINIFSQMSPDYKGGFKIKFDEKGDKYLRFITFLQTQAIYNNDAKPNQEKLNFQIRRARLLAFSQINKDFLVFFHLGLNSLGAESLSPVGKGGSSQFFLHDAYLQYRIFGDKMYAGMGLHAYNGISRLNNQSSTNMVTLSNNRSSWATVGLSDQFARHMGIFVKGNLDKLNYRVSINKASVSSLDSKDLEPNSIKYQGNKNSGLNEASKIYGSRDASKIYAGYFSYNFLDKEKGLLPYMAGSYQGKKELFNIGAGFFSHPNGVVSMDAVGNTKGHDVNIFSIDAFYDKPLGTKNEKGEYTNDKGVITAYAQYQNSDYGKNYNFGPYATGNMLYGHVGYLIPSKNQKLRFQPFIAHSYRTADAIKNESQNTTKIGTNLFLSGHNSKLSIEYNKDNKFGVKTDKIIFQAQILF